MESEFIPLFIISQTLRLNVMGHLKWSFIMLWVLIFNPLCKHNKKCISSIFQQKKDDECNYCQITKDDKGFLNRNLLSNTQKFCSMSSNLQETFQ